MSAQPIRLLYFAGLREKLGSAGEELALPEGVATVSALRGYLSEREGVWREALAGRATLRVAVNQEMAAADMALRPGDEVAFFPPVTGG